MTLVRWQRLMRALGFGPNRDAFDALHSAYSEHHRHYHTTEHIHDCLEKFESLRASLEQPDTVELAIWFHDAIYNPYRNDNEARSAQWAERFLRDNAADPALIEHVTKLILATRHDVPSSDTSALALIDVDLSILGSSKEQFLVYEHAIRREYRWVPSPLYRHRRAEILQYFLERDRIFNTPLFHERHEAQARINLAAALVKLRA